MIRPVYFCGSVLLLAACGRIAEKRNAVTDAIESAQAQEFCFQDITGNDSLLVQLTIVGNDVTGTLRWLPAEKDKMVGTLNGILQNDTITAVYSYQAEGVNAREEKIFRLTTDSLFLAHGELVDQNGTWVLKDKRTARFTEAAGKTDCK
ncbi:hypothetical protein [Dawidia soli]|uniref:Lipoprotein n=1 Tax=Dawidia soli TaxID=2782352 RepID=A0AAP2GBZ0_9BACT|nr:hypothetical protein [Dawidia soli]MBT1685699.1 hypothetical protein [Dawidia soli]